MNANPPHRTSRRDPRRAPPRAAHRYSPHSPGRAPQQQVLEEKTHRRYLGLLLPPGFALGLLVLFPWRLATALLLLIGALAALTILLRRHLYLIPAEIVPAAIVPAEPPTTAATPSPSPPAAQAKRRTRTQPAAHANRSPQKPPPAAAQRRPASPSTPRASTSPADASPAATSGLVSGAAFANFARQLEEADQAQDRAAIDEEAFAKIDDRIHISAHAAKTQTSQGTTRQASASLASPEEPAGGRSSAAHPNQGGPAAGRSAPRSLFPGSSSPGRPPQGIAATAPRTSPSPDATQRLLEAAEEALAADDFVEAQQHYRTLQRTASQEARPLALLGLQLAAAQGDLSTLRQRFEDLLRSGYLPPTDRLDAWLNQLTAALPLVEQAEAKLSLLVRLLPPLRQQGDSGALDRLYTLLLDAPALREHPQKRLDALRSHLELKRSLGDRRGEAERIDQIGAVLFQLGQTQAAREHYAQGLALRQAFETPKKSSGAKPGASASASEAPSPRATTAVSS